MELLLNLAWILLCLPACWVFRRKAPKFSAAQRFFSLACALVILFPVVSATDDLHAAPQAMEESSSTKRTLKARAQDKASAHQFQTSPAQIIVAGSLWLMNEVCRYVPNALRLRHDFIRLTLLESRSPPQLSV
jgi:hypothetical protein